MPSGGGYAFGAFRLDPRARRLLRDGAPVALKPLQFDILHALVSSQGDLVTKDALMKAGWGDQIVSEDSIIQAVSRLRSLPGAGELARCIETVARRGYRFVAEVSCDRTPPRTDDPDAIADEHRTFMNGQAALKTLVRESVASARTTFAHLVERHPERALYHVGHANACVLTFEATRADPTPDVEALHLAATHARRARDLDPDHAEAWATLGFVLERTGDREGAVAALLQAVEIQPDNWRHCVRLAYASWGQQRVDAARRALDQVPGCPMAHCLAATVWVARHSLPRAEREIDAGLAHVSDDPGAPERSAIVALHWLKGLLCLARGAVDDALAAFERELALESRGHLYARECCANTWYAIGVCYMRRGDAAAARAAFGEAMRRVPGHAMAQAGIDILDGAHGVEALDRDGDSRSMTMEQVMARAAKLVEAGDADGAAAVVSTALATAPLGNAGWLIPIEPLLRVPHAPDAWRSVLGTLLDRAR